MLCPYGDVFPKYKSFTVSIGIERSDLLLAGLDQGLQPPADCRQQRGAAAPILRRIGNRATEERQDTQKEETKQDPKEHPAFKVGTLVKTKAAKFKDQWGGHQAKITSLLKGKFKVVMLTGAEKGTKT